MKRMGSQSDLKAPIEFLIDDKNTFMTGQNIIKDFLEGLF